MPADVAHDYGPLVAMCTFYLERKARNDQFGPEIEGLMEPERRYMMRELQRGELDYSAGADIARAVAAAGGSDSADAQRLRELAKKAEGFLEVRDLQNQSLNLHDRIEAAIAKVDGARPTATPELHDLLQQQVALIDQIKAKDADGAACPEYERLTGKLAARAAEFLARHP